MLVSIHGTMDSKKYMRVLNENLTVSAKKIKPCQQDSYPKTYF